MLAIDYHRAQTNCNFNFSFLLLLYLQIRVQCTYVRYLLRQMVTHLTQNAVRSFRGNCSGKKRDNNKIAFYIV
jgi:hypothetical protein